MATSSCGLRYGSARIRTPLTIVKTAVLAPMPTASARTATKWGELVRSPPLVVVRGERGFADQPVGEQPLDDPVERAGAQPDGAARELLDLFQHRVAVGLAVGERDQHVEHRRGEWQQSFRLALRHMASHDMA